MASNTTFILPQWLIAKEPGMTCQSHKYMLNMLATYNIVATVLSVILATPFFVSMSEGVKRVILPWKWGAMGHRQPEESKITAFVVATLGSIGIALAAPLVAGNSIVKNHPDANRWVIIEQWSTRPRATIFVFVLNLIANWVVSDSDCDSDSEHRHSKSNFIVTACSTIVSEIVLSLFGIKFLWNQSSVPLQKFDPRLPCTQPPSEAGHIPLNCPAMQQGAIFLAVTIVINTLLVLLLLLCIPCLIGDDGRSDSTVCLVATICFTGVCMILLIYIGSWVVWLNFLRNTPEELYCVEGSALVDLIYCLLPVALGVWRLLWAYGPHIGS